MGRLAKFDCVTVSDHLLTAQKIPVFYGNSSYLYLFEKKTPDSNLFNFSVVTGKS